MGAGRSGRRSPYKVGYEYEALVRGKLESAGYFVIRSGKSRGPVDLLAIPGPKEGIDTGPVGILFIQAKKGGRLSPLEWGFLVDLARHYSATAVLVEGVRPTRFWKLGRHPHKEEVTLETGFHHGSDTAPAQRRSRRSVRTAEE